MVCWIYHCDRLHLVKLTALRVWGSWTECLPTATGYCPATCADAAWNVKLCTKTLRKSSFLAWSLHVLTFLQKPFLTIWHIDTYSWIRVLRFSLSIFRCVAMAKGEVACDLVEDYLPQRHLLGMGSAFREMRCKPRSMPLPGGPVMVDDVQDVQLTQRYMIY